MWTKYAVWLTGVWIAVVNHIIQTIPSCKNLLPAEFATAGTAESPSVQLGAGDNSNHVTGEDTH